ncbi:MAG: hypothetical protein INR68_05260 [Methylobacterium mesophilicum]|nr:hypothetical protein [Methylobacterium mesophilicum]
MPNSKPSLVLDRLLRRSHSRPTSPAQAYLATTMVILTIAIVRALFITALLPYLFFIPAVWGIALMLGKGPGLYGTALAAISPGVVLGSSAEPAWLTGAQWSSTVLFLVVTALMVLVVAQLHLTYARAGRLTIENDATSTRLSEREAFLASVLASSTDCIKVLDLDGRLTFMSEPSNAADHFYRLDHRHRLGHHLELALLRLRHQHREPV